MKKNVGIIICLFFLLMVTGCSRKGTLTCTMDTTIISGTTVTSEYKIKYTGKYVNSVESVEKFTSNDSDILEKYKEKIESTYLPYENLKYYDYNIYIDGDTLISTVKVDYDNIDADEIIKINSANKEKMEDGKFSLKKVKEAYEKIGITCK